MLTVADWWNWQSIEIELKVEFEKRLFCSKIWNERMMIRKLREIEKLTLSWKCHSTNWSELKMVDEINQIVHIRILLAYFSLPWTRFRNRLFLSKKDLQEIDRIQCLIVGFQIFWMIHWQKMKFLNSWLEIIQNHISRVKWRKSFISHQSHLLKLLNLLTECQCNRSSQSRDPDRPSQSPTFWLVQTNTFLHSELPDYPSIVYQPNLTNPLEAWEIIRRFSKSVKGPTLPSRGKLFKSCRNDRILPTNQER
jgi:hypothetical protein